MHTKTLHLFDRQLYLLAGGFAILCLALGLATWQQGPRLRSVTIDTVKATHLPDQQLLLNFNQVPDPVTKDEVKVTPEVPFSVVNSGKTIALRFSQPLRNGTAYTVRLQVAGSHIVQHRFETAQATIYYVRASLEGDGIYRKELLADKESLIFSTDGMIEDYAVFGETLIAIQKDSDTTNRLVGYDMTARKRFDLALPERGVASSLQASSDGRTFGVLFSASDYQSNNRSRLLLYSLDTRKWKQIKGFDGKAVSAFDWRFARDGASLAVLTSDMTAILLDSSGEPPIPLGQYEAISGFNYDDSALIVDSARSGPQLLDLKTMQRSTIAAPSKDDFPVITAPLYTEKGVVIRVRSYLPQRLGERIVLSRPQGSREIFGLKENEGYIVSSHLSPNDQYIAVEVSSGGQNNIRIIDTRLHKATLTLMGSKPRWPGGL